MSSDDHRGKPVGEFCQRGRQHDLTLGMQMRLWLVDHYRVPGSSQVSQVQDQRGELRDGGCDVLDWPFVLVIVRAEQNFLPTTAFIDSNSSMQQVPFEFARNVRQSFAPSLH